jgi:hypothetical protein
VVLLTRRCSITSYISGNGSSIDNLLSLPKKSINTNRNTKGITMKKKKAKK